VGWSIRVLGPHGVCGCGVHVMGYVLGDNIWCLGVDEYVRADYLRLVILLCAVCSCPVFSGYALVVGRLG
jgi:hypothetical protein